MKTFLKSLVLILILIQGCKNHNKEINQFLYSDDTLVIKAEKQKGDGLFTLGVSPIAFKDTSEAFNYTIIYPQHVTNLERAQMTTDSWADELRYIDIVKGKIADKEVFIVDENNNKNLADDSIRIYQPVKWHTTNNLIMCKFPKSNGKEVIEDSSWIRIGVLRDWLWCGKSEHLIANFSIGKDDYEVGIIDPGTHSFIYKILPEIALLSNNAETKDTLVDKDIFKIGEFLNLNGAHYRFASISTNGEYVTLIKERNFNKMVGTQVGMLAPKFTCMTVSGDTIKSTDLNDRIMIITNSCGCGGDKESTNAYYDMRNKYPNEIHILRLDSKIEKIADGLQVDVDEKFNKDIYDKYRSAYCSRICYVIDKSNRIIDKFPSYAWESNLPQDIKNQ